MRRIRIALIFLGISTILKVVTNANVISEPFGKKAEDRIAELEKTVLNFASRFEKLENENKNLKDVNDDLEHLKGIYNRLPQIMHPENHSLISISTKF